MQRDLLKNRGRRFDAIILVILSESDAMKRSTNRLPRYRGLPCCTILAQPISTSWDLFDSGLIRKEGSGVLSALLSSLE